MEDLGIRKDKIFELIVESHIETAEPVGSRTISRRFNLGLSPASIRNVMADLEEEGLLKQPHTSAGRVPTDRGYRYYVDALMEPKALSDQDKERIVRALSRAKTIEAVAERVSKIMSELTNNATILYIKNLKRVSFLNYLLEDLIETHKLNDFFEEDSEIFIEGAFRIFEQPEFHNIQKMRHLLRAFDEEDDFLQALLEDLHLQGVRVHIGSENSIGNLEDVSLVVKDYYYRNAPIGGIAVVGPTRMNYAKAVALVDFVADTVTEAVSRF